MIKITIYIDETEKDFDYQKAHNIYESLSDSVHRMEVEKIKSRTIFEKEEE